MLPYVSVPKFSSNSPIATPFLVGLGPGFMYHLNLLWSILSTYFGLLDSVSWRAIILGFNSLDISCSSAILPLMPPMFHCMMLVSLAIFCVCFGEAVYLSFLCTLLVPFRFLFCCMLSSVRFGGGSPVWIPLGEVGPEAVFEVVRTIECGSVM